MCGSQYAGGNVKIRSIDECLKKQGKKFVIYGGTSAGKTSLIRTIPGKVLILSAEAGLLSLAGLQADVVEIDGVQALRDAHKALAAGGHGYDWVALDSLSEIAEVVLADEKAKTKDPRQAYGSLIDTMLGVCRAFRDLPMNVYMTAKEERFKDEATGRLMCALSMPGSKLGGQIPYLFDEVLRLVVVKNRETGAVERWLQTQPEPTSDAKDRSGKLDQYEPPDLAHVVAKIEGDK